jgi:hypothetical protein
MVELRDSRVLFVDDRQELMGITISSEMMKLTSVVSRPLEIRRGKV